MNFKEISILLLISGLTLNSCKNTKNEEKITTANASNEIKDENTRLIENNNSKSDADDNLAPLIADYINNKFLKPADKKVMSEIDKKFSMHQSDLNNDGQKEVFVYLNSPYFCGTGGCTILLLSPNQELITKFTVTNPPIFIEPTFKNDWKILTVKSEGEWKELLNINGSYPSNPTVLDKASYDAPSGHAEIAFDEKENLKFYKF
ncbi:hypothetical protein J4771_03290 [Candidatus Kaistella beijingensis]|uniref:hypothetical protein n=1 Tax=Candidatus Kaistella beijingensis TaxID=2820270 RepID=UPI001CC7E421|nr:hypothetical protein [Candidatus Kaistella beijingensis]UBB90393.1 hypothetical protein J4771_03290 [Candidatus Kaistella beijingensis]